VPISVAGLDMREFSKCITALATWVRSQNGYHLIHGR
jgi:hypothetical protein